MCEDLQESQATAPPHSPVVGEVLKAEDVQQADGASHGLGLCGWRFVDGSVDLVHDPNEQPAVNSLGFTVTPMLDAL